MSLICTPMSPMQTRTFDLFLRRKELSILVSRDRDVAGRVRSRCQPKVCWLAGRDLACAASSTATARLRLLVVSANSTCCLHANVAQQGVPVQMLQFCLWLMLALRWSARENGLLAVLLLVRDMPAPASSRRNALLQLPLLLCC